MNILVIGCDQVGAALIRDLERIGHDISVVEKDPEQLKRLDPLVDDLKHSLDYVENGIRDVVDLIPSHDASGRATGIIAIRFDTPEQAAAFAACEGVWGTVPINTGKHVYTNWLPILEHRGALNPGMDPFKMPQNQGLQMDYTPDMCPNTLKYLSTTVYTGIQPWGNGEWEWQAKDCEWKIGVIRDAAKKVLG